MEEALTSAGITFEKVPLSSSIYTEIRIDSSTTSEQLQQAQQIYDTWIDTENQYFQASEAGLKV